MAMEVSMQMCAAGASQYRAWEADKSERDKLNAVANLVSRIYRAMDEIHEQQEAST